jgi:DNA mismatch repair ATPase MutS
VQNQIKQISDLERLISKIASGKVSPMVYLKESLDAIIPIKHGFRKKKSARSGKDYWRQFA